jgi:hypothetical protein
LLVALPIITPANKPIPAPIDIFDFSITQI